MKPSAGIYEIRNTLNGHRYIGQAADVAERLLCHRQRLTKRKHINRHLQNAWNKYGEGAFVFSPMALVYPPATKERLTELEQEAVDLFKPEYNIRRQCVTSQLGVKHTAEMCAKMSAMKLAYFAQHPEVRAEMSAARRGRAQRPESVAKRNASNTGKRRTEEQRARMTKGIREAMKRPEVRSAIAENKRKFYAEHPEAREAQRQKMLGTHPSEKTLAALRATHLGKKQSPTTIERRRQGMFAHFVAHPDLFEERRARARNLGLNKEMQAKATLARRGNGRRGKKQSPVTLERRSLAMRAVWIAKALGLPQQGPEQAVQ